ncbi:hypothetical protein [Microbacterium terregens]|uniref:Uncharacterized protein n=1 Tax=Microbacterium terregens TaxID=69363 RepID=A0ABV5SYK8_9MICO
MTPTLTGLLNSSKSHLSRYMAETFPNHLPMRQRIRAAAGDIRQTPGTGRDGSGLGSAFDVMADVVVDPEPYSVSNSSMMWTKNHAALAHFASTQANASVANRAADADFYRSVWVLGMLVSSIRSMQSYMSSPLTEVLRRGSDLDGVLDALGDDLIPAAGISELRMLDEIATIELYPHLKAPAHFQPWLGTDYVQAQGDVIAGGVLLDLKADRGTANSVGRFSYLPPTKTIYQLVCYGLLSTEHIEQYGDVASLGIYAARYGSLTTWPLQGLLDELAGKPMDAGAELQMVRALIMQEEYDPTS